MTTSKELYTVATTEETDEFLENYNGDIGLDLQSCTLVIEESVVMAVIDGKAYSVEELADAHQ